MPLDIISFLELSYSLKSRCTWKKRELGTVSIWSASPFSTQRVGAFAPTLKIHPPPYTGNAVSLASHALPSPTLLNMSYSPQLGRKNAEPVRCLSPLTLPTTLGGRRHHYPRFPMRKYSQPQGGCSPSMTQGHEARGNEPGLRPRTAWLWGASSYPSSQDVPRKLDC